MYHSDRVRCSRRWRGATVVFVYFYRFARAEIVSDRYFGPFRARSLWTIGKIRAFLVIKVRNRFFFLLDTRVLNLKTRLSVCWHRIDNICNSHIELSTIQKIQQILKRTELKANKKHPKRNKRIIFLDITLSLREIW